MSGTPRQSLAGRYCEIVLVSYSREASWRILRACQMLVHDQQFRSVVKMAKIPMLFEPLQRKR